MSQTLVTIVDPLGDNRFEVELPDDAPMEQLVPQLLPKLGITQAGDFKLLLKRTNVILGPRDTLRTAGVMEGDALRVVSNPTAARIIRRL
jgi:hypothetical protein